MKAIVSLTGPAYGDKEVNIAAKVAEFLGLEPVDVLVLSEGCTVQVVEGVKSTPHKKETAEGHAGHAAHGHGHTHGHAHSKGHAKE